MVGVGLISYSLYLVHWPIVSFLTYWQLRPPGAAEVPLILSASLMFAMLSWRFVEQPFRIGKRRLPRWVLLGGAIGAMACAASLGLAVLAAHGLPGRFADVTDRAQADPQEGYSACFQANNPNPHDWNLADCTITHGGAEKALLWGDSYANHYAPGLKAHAGSIPYSILVYSAAGCPPVLSYEAYGRPGCHAFNQAALGVIDREHIKTVVLAARWVDLRQRGLKELTSTLRALSARGVDTWIIGQSPMFATDVHVIAWRQGAAAADARWTISFDRGLNRKLAAMARPGRFVDPLSRLCEADLCAYRARGELLFSDEGHFSKAGSDLAVRTYFPLADSRRDGPNAGSAR
jgi:hypothetical protein